MKATPNIEQQLRQGDITTQLDEQGVPEYTLNTPGDLEECARLIEAHLEKEQLIAHDFTTRVWNKNRSGYATIQYRSGWPLEGLVEGELE